VLDDSQEDIKKLYNALNKNNKREATLIFTHLVRFHKLSRKVIAERIKLMGAEKIARVSIENRDKQ